MRRARGVRLGKRASLLAGGIAAVTVAALSAWLLTGDRETGRRGAATGAATSPAPAFRGGLGGPGPSSDAAAGAPAQTASPGAGPIAGNGPAPAANRSGSAPAVGGVTPAPPGVSRPVSAPAAPATTPPGKVLTSPGGTVRATCDDGKATLSGPEPAEGYTVGRVEPGPSAAPLVVFEGPADRYRITVTCVAGTPTPVVLPL
jgi:serine/threonine-protein kinase